MRTSESTNGLDRAPNAPIGPILTIPPPHKRAHPKQAVSAFCPMPFCGVDTHEELCRRKTTSGLTVCVAADAPRMRHPPPATIANGPDQRQIDADAGSSSPETCFVLRPVRPDGTIAAVALTAGRYVVGSATTCDVQIQAEGVEPKHCLIVAGPHRAAVRAYDPETRLNGIKVDEAPFAAGDILSVGPIEMRLESMDGNFSHTCVIMAMPQSAEESHPEVNHNVPANDGPEVKLRRWRDELLRRENDLIIAAAAANAASRARALVEPVASVGPAARDDNAEQHANLNRRERRLAEITHELAASQTALLARERAVFDRSALVDSWFAAASAAEAKFRDEERAAAEARERLHAARLQFEQRDDDVTRRLAEVERREKSLEARVAEIVAREQAVQEDSQSCHEARVRLAADRDALEQRFSTFAEERSRLRQELAETTSVQESKGRQPEQDAESLRVLEELQQELDDRAAVQRAAEIDLAWQQRELEWAAVEIGWQRSEAEDLAQELASARVAFEQELATSVVGHGNASDSVLSDHLASTDWQARVAEENARLAALSEALVAERAALRAEESRFNAARQEFAQEQERFGESVRLELARRDTLAAATVAASSCEALAIHLPEARGNERECVVDVAAGGTHAAVDESLRELEQTLATLFDSGDASTRTDIIAADSNAGYWTPLENLAPPIRVGGIELDDAANPDSVARYMQELLQRMREDNPLFPSDARTETEEGKTASQHLVEDLPPSPVILQPFELPAPLSPVNKEELRSQTATLRDIANQSARAAIGQHSLRLKKAELVAKGVLTTVAILIGGFLMAVFARFGSSYLWHVLAGSATVLFVTYDFLVSFQKLAEQIKDERSKKESPPEVAAPKAAQMETALPATSELVVRPVADEADEGSQESSESDEPPIEHVAVEATMKSDV